MRQLNDLKSSHRLFEKYLHHFVQLLLKLGNYEIFDSAYSRNRFFFFFSFSSRAKVYLFATCRIIVLHNLSFKSIYWEVQVIARGVFDLYGKCSKTRRFTLYPFDQALAACGILNVWISHAIAQYTNAIYKCVVSLRNAPLSTCTFVFKVLQYTRCLRAKRMAMVTHDSKICNVIPWVFLPEKRQPRSSQLAVVNRFYLGQNRL